jgi:hypothetical protein
VFLPFVYRQHRTNGAAQLDDGKVFHFYRIINSSESAEIKYLPRRFRYGIFTNLSHNLNITAQVSR